MTTRKKTESSAEPTGSATATSTPEGSAKTPLDLALESFLAAVADLPDVAATIASGDYRIIVNSDGTLLSVTRR
jgi:hypothetical protein